MNDFNAARPQLKRSLNLSLVTFYGIGTILGAGIFVLLGKVAGYAHMQTPLAFLLAMLLAAFSAFSYAELAARFPLCAGEAIYVYKGFEKRSLAILVGISIIVAGTLSVATLLHGVVGYLRVLFEFPAFPAIVAIAVIMGLIVAWGITESVVITTFMTLLSLFGLLLIVWVARDSYLQLPSRLPEMLPSADWSIWKGILMGGFIAFYAFLGFEDIVNVAEEARDPRRNIPLAIILALVITTFFYLAIAIATVLTLASAQIADSDAPLAVLYRSVTGRSPVLITLISLISVLNGSLIQIIKASRILYGMGRQGWLPLWLGQVHPRTRTPVSATLTVTVLITLFALSLPLLSLAKLSSFVTLIVFALINLSLMRIKLYAVRPSKTLTVPFWIPVTGFIASSGFVGYQIYSFVFE